MHSYRPDIDGLRAIAVVAVFLFHADAIATAQGGFVGVDVFFVISGFLIGRMVDQQVVAGEFSFLNFYERRARRLAGPLLIVLFGSYVAGYFLLMPIDLDNLADSIIASLFLFANHHFYEELDYFNSDVNLKPLLHLWTLSVEEQFYLIFPLLVFYSKRAVGNRLPAFLAGGLSFLAVVIIVRIDEQAAFYLLPCRAWELLLGYFVYLVGSRGPRLSSKALDGLAILGLVMVGWSIMTFDDGLRFPGETALVPCLGAALLIYVNSFRMTMVGHILAFSPLVLIGKLSYSIYLFHWPVIVFSQYYLDRTLNSTETGIVFFSVFVMSYLSFKFVEKPMRQRTFQIVPSETIVASIIISVIIAITVYPATRNGGYSDRLPPESVRFSTARNDWSADQFACVDRTPEKIITGDVCQFNMESRGPSVLLWGDSHATVLLPLLQKIALEDRFKLVFVGTNGCPPLMDVETEKGYCKDTNSAVANMIKERQFDVVAIAANWQSYGGSNIAFVNGRRMKRNDIELENSLDRTSLVTQLANARLLVVGQVPTYDIDIPNYLTKQSFLASIDSLTGYNRSRPKPHLDPKYLINAVANIAPDGKLGPSQILCNPTCRISDELTSLYKDGGHLSLNGSRVLYEAMVLELRRLLPLSRTGIYFRSPDENWDGDWRSIFL